MKLIALLIVLCLSGFAMFLALRVWTNDQIDRNRVHWEIMRRRPLKEGQLSASRTAGLVNDQALMIEMMQLQVDAMIVNNSRVNTLEHYNATRDAILLVNASCSLQIAAMSVILSQLIEGTNSTPTNVQTGSCILSNSGLTNDTMTVAVDYQLLSISGLDFYYYLFGVMESPLLVDSAHPAEFANCYPSLFLGDPIQHVLLKSSFSSAIVGGGKARLISTVNQTFQFLEPLTLWTSLLV
jgi:hypothetical protein